MSDLEAIQKKILSFRNERDWAQFHDPKNLAEALSIEAGELLENFLWKTTEQSRNLTDEELKNVKEELADIFIFLTYLIEELKIDLLSEVDKKIAVNEMKYPVGESEGLGLMSYSVRMVKLLAIHLKYASQVEYRG